jgi:tetratricopeptide (TPR) repeat protein
MGVRAEAEELILRKKVSKPVDPSQIVQNRQSWKSITFSMNAGEQMAKQTQWVPAAEYYAKVMQDPAFDWVVFEINQDMNYQKMALAFLLAGDQTNYCALIRALLSRKPETLSPTMQERYAQIFVINTELMTPELKQQALAYARQVCDTLEVSIWVRLLRGTIEYREGHFDSAVESFEQIFFMSNNSLAAARAKAFQAMAYKRLGRTSEVLEAAQAASQFGDWTNLTYYQVAMRELLALLATPAEPTKSL